MSAPFVSPAPWTVNANGGARTIVARDRSVVAVVLGCDSASPFDDGNAALMAAAPALREALAAFAELPTSAETPGVHADHEMDERIRAARAALAKSEQDGGAPEDGPVETGTGV